MKIPKVPEPRITLSKPVATSGALPLATPSPEVKPGQVDLRRVPMGLLKPAPYNPRTMSAKAKAGLRNSISAFGLVEPIIWNQQTGNIVGGHQRYAELKDRGIVETDVVVVNLDEAKEKALNVVLNNSHISGDFTAQVLDLLAEIEKDQGLESYVNLQLDALELELKKEFNDQKDLEMKENLKEPEAEPENSNVKQVQLFYDSTTYPLFMELVQELKKKFMTDNPTDTVLEALKYAVSV